MFDGVSVALVTPFKGGALDEDGFRRVLDHVLDQGVQGVVVTGSTGETPTLTLEERARVWKLAREHTGNRGFLVAGTGTNSTRESIELTRRAADLGVDGCMVVAPYYNKPTQEGMAAHFLAVADAVEVPLVIYNVPGRTGVNILPRTLAGIAGHERIVAVKEASGSLDQATELCRDTDLTVLSGDDSLTLPAAAVGAKGIVSVAGHLVGRELVSMLQAFARGENEAAARIHRSLFGLIQALFLEPNPAPVKAALAHLGLIADELRAPLAPVGDATRERLRKELERIAPAPIGRG